MKKRNLFVIGLEDFHLNKLKALHGAENYEYHQLLTPAEVVDTYDFPMEHLLGKAREQLNRFPESIDAILSYWDFPASTMLPILCREYGVRGPTLESVLKCQHKYWSRLLQREVVPDMVPDFRLFDPFDDDALTKLDLPYPFWIKPVKSRGSFLGFRVKSAADFQQGIAIIRDKIQLLATPFDHIASQAELPEEIAGIGGAYCIAEGIISGRQCTVDGYVQDGEVHVYGVVDSIRQSNRSSFARYQYPSQMPFRVRDRMAEAIQKVLTHVGFDQSGVNVEFFWDQESDRLWLLEINTRITQSHGDLYEKVDGVSNHQVMVDIALGRRPEFPYRRGGFKRAAKFFLRTTENAFVRYAPSGDELRRVSEAIPGAFVLPQVGSGMWLSDIVEQDSYSYALAHIYLGGRNQKELLERYDQVVSMLDFQLTDREEERDSMPMAS